MESFFHSLYFTKACNKEHILASLFFDNPVPYEEIVDPLATLSVLHVHFLDPALPQYLLIAKSAKKEPKYERTMSIKEFKCHQKTPSLNKPFNFLNIIWHFLACRSNATINRATKMCENANYVRFHRLCNGNPLSRFIGERAPMLFNNI